MLLEFFRQREALWQATFGRRLRPTPLRDFLVRHVVLDFGEGRTRHIADYQALLRGQVAGGTVRNELARLADAGIIVLEAEPADRRARAVRPTVQTVDFYNRVMPSLVEAVELLRQRETNKL